MRVSAPQLPLPMFTDPETGELRRGIAKVRYSHDAMIDLLVQDPAIRQNDLAVIFDRSPAWISQIINSDAFQARLEERRGELVDPIIRQTIEERIRALAQVSLDKLMERVVSPLAPTDDFLLRTTELSLRAAGYGARVGGPGGGSTNVAVVIQVPQKATSVEEWARSVGGANA